MRSVKINANANDSQLYVSHPLMTSVFAKVADHAAAVITGARLRRMRPLMGTLCIIECAAPSGAPTNDVESAVQAAYEHMRLVDDLMHPQRGIDLSRINQSAGRTLEVHALTWRVLQLAKQIHESSNGVFDPCLPSCEGTMSHVELLPDNRVICHMPVSMDMGGIAKGFAVDCAIDVLQRAGCRSGLVNAGGDIRVFGETQIMHIAGNPQSIELCDQALAVSEYHHADHPAEHRGYYHRDSGTSPIYMRVAVMAETAAIADALTKCAMWMDDAVHQAWFASLQAKVLLAQK